MHARHVGLERFRIVRGRALHGLAEQATLAECARTHLVAKAKSGKGTEAWLALSEHHLNRAVEHFGAARDLASITTADVRKWGEALHLAGLSGGTARHHLDTLSKPLRASFRVHREGADRYGVGRVEPIIRHDHARSRLGGPDLAAPHSETASMKP